MKISVVSPSFNQGRFISKCLSSVRAQKGDFLVEHIILDNCSTDNTIKQLKYYASDPGQVDTRIIIKPDRGQADAINKGFLMSKGDIVCWLNTDEYYHSGALAKVAEFFTLNDDVDVLFGNCDLVDAAGNPVRQRREYFYSRSMLIFYGCFIPSCATFVRRRVIEDGVFLNPGFRVVMDFDWYVRIAKAGYRFSRIADSLASFTWHENNISKTFVRQRKFERRIVQDLNSGIVGPEWMRSTAYFIMQNSWVTIRVLRRAWGSITAKFN